MNFEQRIRLFIGDLIIQLQQVAFENEQLKAQVQALKAQLPPEQPSEE